MLKRTLSTILLLALVLALLSGCAGEFRGADPTAETGPESGMETPAAERETEPAGTGETGAAQAAATGREAMLAAHDWAEPEAVDDSFSFDFEWRVSCDCDGAYEHFLKEELPAYLDRWVDGGEILGSHFVGIDESSFGWVCFTGTPRTELGWRQTEYKGQSCYCRGLVVLGPSDRRETQRHYEVAKSFAMEPVEMLKGYLVTEEHELLDLEKALPALQSAELYVPQLGQSFLLTEPEALRSLEAAFSQPDNEVERIQETSAGFERQSGFLPLYLHYADGSSSLALAAGDGSDACMVWSGAPDSVFGAQSLFERFGVPLPSPGYTHHADGTTTLEQHDEGVDSSLGLKTERTAIYSFDAQGRLVCFDYSFHREDEVFDESSRKVYSYRADGKIETIDFTWESAQTGRHSDRMTYTYNAKGQLERYTLEDLDTPGKGMYYEYLYDEQDRIQTVVYHYLDGREGMPSGNSYFWYDEQGLRHSYAVDAEGHLIGGPGGEDGDHPPRR